MEKKTEYVKELTLTRVFDAPADFPQDVRNVLTFKSIGGKTEMTITQYCFPGGPTREFAVMGLTQSLGKLAEVLSKA
jgi:hypothetical protein